MCCIRAVLPISTTTSFSLFPTYAYGNSEKKKTQITLTFFPAKNKVRSQNRGHRPTESHILKITTYHAHHISNNRSTIFFSFVSNTSVGYGMRWIVFAFHKSRAFFTPCAIKRIIRFYFIEWFGKIKLKDLSTFDEQILCIHLKLNRSSFLFE